MVRAIGDQVEKKPEYLSILDKKAIKNEKIDDALQKEQVSVMNKLLNDALRAKGYAGSDIKMVLTDVEEVTPGMYGISTGVEAILDNKNGVIGRKISFGKSYRDLGAYIKTGVSPEIISKEEYELFDYLKKTYPKGGKNGWK